MEWYPNRIKCFAVRWKQSWIIPKCVIVGNSKGGFFLIYFTGPIVKNIYLSLNYQPSFDTYNSIWFQSAINILEYFSVFSSVFAHNISCPFYIYFNPPLPTQFSYHILCTVFDHSFHISVLFQNQHFVFFSLSCHVLIIYTCTELHSVTRHTYHNVLTVVTYEVVLIST
jgi:hypothetical protein